MTLLTEWEVDEINIRQSADRDQRPETKGPLNVHFKGPKGGLIDFKSQIRALKTLKAKISVTKVPNDNRFFQGLLF